MNTFVLKNFNELTVTGRGTIFVIDILENNISALIAGDCVIANDLEYEVIAIEAMRGSNNISHKVGLVVKETSIIFDKIQKHIREREAINKELCSIIKHYDNNDNSPIEIFEGDWLINGESLHLQHSDDPIDEEYHAYTISSLGAKGKDLFIGEKNGHTYVMAYLEDGNWEETIIFVLNNKNKVTNDDE